MKYIIIFLLLINTAFAHEYLEKEYQDKWCKEHKGSLEVVLKSGERADCITNEYAIEFDFAKKYCEAIGQSLLYSIESNKKAGIVLILEKASDEKYLKRLHIVSDIYNIRVWTVDLDYIKQ
jgi:hypothetical protein